MRILLLSDIAPGTGFGRVGRELTRRFLDAGHQTRILGVNHRGRSGEISAFSPNQSAESIGAFVAEFDADPINRVTVPAQAGGDLFGHALTAPAINGSLWPDGWQPDRVLVVADPRAMAIRVDKSPDIFATVPTFNYVPIEGVGLPQCWDQIWKNVTPVAMSEFGRAQLQTLLGRPVTSIPHGISPVFHPISMAHPGHIGDKAITTKEDAKRAFRLEGHLVLLRTDRFVPRKNYAALFRSVGPILAAHPEAILVIHCAPNDEGGLMAEQISRLPGAFATGPLWRHPQVRFLGAHDTYRGMSDEALNVLYNAADIYVSPTMAEGFGLTLAEAAACGVPVVTTDYAAGPETVGDGGVLVPVDRLLTNVDSYEWALVDEPKFTTAVAGLADDAERRAELGRAGVEYVKRFSWDDAARDWLELMT